MFHRGVTRMPVLVVPWFPDTLFSLNPCAPAVAQGAAQHQWRRRSQGHGKGPLGMTKSLGVAKSLANDKVSADTTTLARNITFPL